MDNIRYLALLWLRLLLIINSKSKHLGRNDKSQKKLTDTTTEILKMEMNNDIKGTG